MTVLSDMLVMLLLLTNLRILSSSRIDACIQAVVVQAFILATLTITASLGDLGIAVLILTGTTLGVKGFLLPWLLRRAARDAGVSLEIEPFVGFAMSVLIGAGLLGVCYAISRPLQNAAPEGTAAMLIPGAMFTILTGLMIIITRRKALTQVIGYLTLENGVYVFGAALALDEPMLVEMGILLDVFVAVFVMGIVIHQINHEFDHIDTDRLSELRD